METNTSGKVGQIVAEVNFHPGAFESLTKPGTAEYQKRIAEIKAITARENTPGHNEHGVPVHACNGYRQDEHYWALIGQKRSGGVL